ncbi:TIR domain-containing protein [Ideonella sp. YS5]|uniref:toll/interleukin-1 receptor domain-containing protein n=1 Tax=Ideonella sp. YS5 TaxID=3453714 RepID=UPI003EEA2F00
MSYLPGFRFDLFLSYRHDADQGPVKWVSTFRERVHTSLKSRIGDVEIYKDDLNLVGSDHWRERIVEALDHSAIFVAILSGTYYQSSECLFELESFLMRLKESNDSPSRRRALLPVLKHPPAADEPVPPEIQAAQHVQFFDYDPPGSRLVREFDLGASREAALQFETALQRFVAELEVKLNDMRGVASQSMGTVFLADVGIDQSVSRDKIKADLRQRGYTVLPAAAKYLWTGDHVLDQVKADIAKADLCVHPISAACSGNLDIPQRSRVQLDMAVEAMRAAGKPMPVVWIERDASPDEGARELVQHVKTTLADQGVDHWSGSMEDFKTDLVARLEALLDMRKAAALEVAMVFEAKDVEATPELSDLLVGLSIEPERVKLDGTSPRNPALAAKLATRKGLRCVVLWAGESEEWLSELMDSEVLRPFLGKDSLCIYCVQPYTADKRAFRTGRAQIILGTADDHLGQLRRFLGNDSVQ